MEDGTLNFNVSFEHSFSFHWRTFFHLKEPFRPTKNLSVKQRTLSSTKNLFSPQRTFGGWRTIKYQKSSLKNLIDPWRTISEPFFLRVLFKSDSKTDWPVLASLLTKSVIFKFGKFGKFGRFGKFGKFGKFGIFGILGKRGFNWAWLPKAIITTARSRDDDFMTLIVHRACRSVYARDFKIHLQSLPLRIT